MNSGFREALHKIIIAGASVLALNACSNTAQDGSKPGMSDKTSQSVASAMQKAGDASRNRGDNRSAAAFYQRAHNADPNSVGALNGLGESYAAAGVFKQAAAAFRKALAVDKKNTRALRGLGNVLIAQDQPDLAIAEFEKVLASDPKDFRAYNGLGVAHDAGAQHSKAQEYYYAGLEIVPGDVNLRSNLGLSLAFSGHYTGAIDVLLPLARRKGATARDRQNLALAYGLAGKVDEATKFSRMDMDSQAVQRNLSYYAALRSMTDPILRVKSVRAGYALRGR